MLCKSIDKIRKLQ